MDFGLLLYAGAATGLLLCFLRKIRAVVAKLEDLLRNPRALRLVFRVQHLCLDPKHADSERDVLPKMVRHV